MVLDKSSLFAGLRCRRCDNVYPEPVAGLLCPVCAGFLEAAYDLEAARRRLDRDRLAARPFTTMWRYAELLPLRDPAHRITLSEGATPLLPSRAIGPRLGLSRLYFKDETRNPTGSFKDRGASVTASKCRETGQADLVLFSAGNGTAALAAYAGIAGQRLVALLAPDASPVHVAQVALHGATTVVLSADGAHDRLLADLVARYGWFDAGVPRNLYRVEGKKTIALELAEQLGWREAPHVICPTAGGTNLLALSKGFAELRSLGWVDAAPRLTVVQTETCAPVVAAFEGDGIIRRWPNPTGIAMGLHAPFPSAGPRLLEILRESGGAAVSVSDAETLEAERELARDEGLFVQPASAAGLAGLKRLVSRRAVDADAPIVCILTGSGKNAPEIAVQAAPPPIRIPAALDAFLGAVMKKEEGNR